MQFEQYITRDGSKVIVPIPTCYNDCLELLKSDYYRIYRKVDSLPIIWLKSFRDRALKHLFWLRFASFRGWLYPLCKFFHEYYKLRYDCRVHAGAKIGYGLYLGHAMSMCVNVRCIIGNNVNLSQMCNVGTNSGDSAIIADNVYIGPMSCLIEGVHIGENTLVGAGAIVTRDITSNSTAVGNPCRVIGLNKHPEYVHNRWIIK